MWWKLFGLFQVVMQVVENGGGGVLDVLVWLVVFQYMLDVVVMVDFYLVQVGGFYQIVQWYFEYFGYFIWLWYGDECWIDYGYYGYYLVIGDGDEWIQVIEYVYLIVFECDFFIVFVDCCGYGVVVVCFYLFIGKVDLVVVMV